MKIKSSTFGVNPEILKVFCEIGTIIGENTENDSKQPAPV